MIDIKKLYYAHHVFKYNTKEEKQEIELIEKKFPNFLIINPNEWICQDNSEQAIMNQCYHFVKMSDILVFSSLNTIIGRGVYEEVQLALEENKDVYYLLDNNFYKINLKDFLKVNIIYNETNDFRKYASTKDLEKLVRRWLILKVCPYCGNRNEEDFKKTCNICDRSSNGVEEYIYRMARYHASKTVPFFNRLTKTQQYIEIGKFSCAFGWFENNKDKFLKN